MIRALILAIGIFLPTTVNASPYTSLPFAPNPTAFRTYLNALEGSSDGSTYEYLALRSCYKNFSGGALEYTCRSADYKQTNTLGTRTCVNGYIQYRLWQISGSVYIYRGSSNEECGSYERVRPNIMKSLKGRASDEYLLIGGGVLLFGAGVGSVLAVSGLRKQRTDATKPQKNDGEVEE